MRATREDVAAGGAIYRQRKNSDVISTFADELIHQHRRRRASGRSRARRRAVVCRSMESQAYSIMVSSMHDDVIYTIKDFDQPFAQIKE
jgi:hypothetical protein